MPNFRTIVNPLELKSKIGYQTEMLFLGSCFTENIGGRFNAYKFPAVINPFGVLYNPASIQKSISRLATGQPYTEEELFFHNSLYNSFDHYTKFSATTVDETLNNINQTFSAAAEHLKKAKFVFITLGTAFVYRHLKTNKIVSNNHKLPEAEFERRLLKVNEVADLLGQIVNQLAEATYEAEIILTVSPIRHLKDGAQGNQLSKSTLLVAANECANKFENVSYFPAYEIVMDDLRDYRFYEDDMLHPNQQAIEYIWEKCLNSFVDENSKNIMAEVYKIVLASRHKPLNAASKIHQTFVKKQLELVGKIATKYPAISLEKERAFFEEQLV